MLRKFLSLFSRKEVVSERRVKSYARAAKSNGSLKKEIAKIRSHSVELQEELAKIKEHVEGFRENNKIIEHLHQKQESHERAIASYMEKLNHLDSRLQDHRIDIVELKSRLSELNHALVKVEAIAKKVEELESAMQSKPEMPKVLARVARAPAPEGSLLEQYHSLAPSTKKILRLLLQMHIDNKGKWVALSDLRSLVYPGEVSNSTLAAMAKAIRPLYANGFVEKKRDKSFVYVAATKKGREAAKEAGLSQQAEKFDAVFANMDK